MVVPLADVVEPLLRGVVGTGDGRGAGAARRRGGEGRGAGDEREDEARRREAASCRSAAFGAEACGASLSSSESRREPLLRGVVGAGTGDELGRSSSSKSRREAR